MTYRVSVLTVGQSEFDSVAKAFDFKRFFGFVPVIINQQAMAARAALAVMIGTLPGLPEGFSPRGGHPPFATFEEILWGSM